MSSTKTGSRRYHEESSAGYFLPSDASEIKRLNDQHIIIKQMFKGKLLFAPLDLSKAGKVLDSGTGTGAWISDLANDYPETIFEGVDMVIDNFYHPHEENVSVKKVNLIQENQLEKGTYSLINQRLLVAGFTAANWKHVLTQFYDLLEPEGWIQLGEYDLARCPEYRGEVKESAVSQLMIWFRAIAGKLNINIDISYLLEDLLKEAGFVVGGKEIGSISTTDPIPPPATITGVEWIMDVLTVVTIKAVDFGWVTREEYDVVFNKARQEAESSIVMEMRYVWAKKPTS